MSIKSAVRVFHGTLLCTVLLLAASFPPQSYAQEYVRIFLDSTSQVIRGFGAANIVGWRPDMTEDEIETAFGIGDGRLGFSILRVRVPPDESQWSVNVPTAQQAHEMGVKIIASPWSPPAHMKTNGDLIGGQLREDMFDDYAAHLDSFSTYMSENGAPLYAISVQNEPDIQVTYESCDWTAGDMRQFVSENAPTIGTRIMAPESFQFRRPLSDILLQDPGAAENLDIVAGHIYGGGLAPYPLAEEKGKEVWMTEHLVLENDLEASIGTGVEIQNVMKAGMSAYVWWYIVRYYGPISDGETDDYAKGEITKRGYVMSQFSRFIRPGFMRIHTDGPDAASGVSVTAYRDSSTVVFVAVNDASSPRNVAFNVVGGMGDVASRHVTSATQNVERLDDVHLSDDGFSDNGFSTTLDANTVTTFVSEYQAVSRENVDIPTGSYRLSPNHPNPFSSSSIIEFVVPGTSDVALHVFDILGRPVATLLDGMVSPGRHRVRLDASGWPAGVYLYRFRADGVVMTRRMTLVR